MTDVNHSDGREYFRVEGADVLVAELELGGRTHPCTVDNMSAGGACVRVFASGAPGDRVRLRVRTSRDDELAGAAAPPYVAFAGEILDVSTEPMAGSPHAGDAQSIVRLRFVPESGSAGADAATRIVFEAQRLLRARSLGTDDASPMATDPERRAALRPSFEPRFNRGSLRPDTRE